MKRIIVFFAILALACAWTNYQTKCDDFTNRLDSLNNISPSNYQNDDSEFPRNAKSIGSTTHTNPIRGKVKAKTFLGNLTGDVTGATSGIHTGYVIGNVTGATSGIHTGSVICNLTGIVTGDVIGNVRGNIQSVISALNTFDIRTTTASLFGITGNVTITNTDIRARLVKLYEY